MNTVLDAGPGFVAQPSLLCERQLSRSVVPAVETLVLPQRIAAREEDDQVLIPADSLFFQVSSNTGRLHAFRREGDGFTHLNSVPPVQLSLDRDTTVEYPFPYKSSAVRSAAAAFLAVWDALSARDHNLLWGAKMPLRLPLDDALEAARAAHTSMPSTKRSVKAIDVIPPPPAGATGPRYVYLRRGTTQRLQYQQYISAEGDWLCRACSREPARVQHPAGPDPLVSCLLDLCCSEGCHDRCVRCACACFATTHIPTCALQPALPDR